MLIHFEDSMNGSPSGETRTTRIERLAMKTLSIETSLTNHLAKCDPQSQSPFFATLPKEIRDMIWQHATEQYESLSQAYPETAFHYRPGYRGPHKTSTNILLTCRRIWLEANALPMRQNVLSFWFEASRGPTPTPQYNIDSTWTRLNRANFTTLQLFTQRHKLIGLFQRPTPARDLIERLQPKVLRITVRHTDWNRWEDPLPLSLESAWLQTLLDAPYLPSLATLHVELETLTQNIPQLNPIIDRLSQLRGKARPLAPPPNPNSIDRTTTTTAPQHQHTQLLPSPSDFTTWSWTGPPNINNVLERAHKDMKELNYHVAVLTWKAVPCSATATGTITTEVTFSTPRIMFQGHAMMRRRPPPTMNDHMLRLQLLKGGWDHYQFPFGREMVRKFDVENANRTEGAMRARFRRMFADIEVARLEKKWREESSLLKFED